MNLKFDIQRFRDEEDVTYRGRRRWSGNHGQIWLNNSKVFEHKSFECKVVFNRDFNEYFEEQKAGHTTRAF